MPVSGQCQTPWPGGDIQESPAGLSPVPRAMEPPQRIGPREWTERRGPGDTQGTGPPSLSYSPAGPRPPWESNRSSLFPAPLSHGCQGQCSTWPGVPASWCTRLRPGVMLVLIPSKACVATEARACSPRSGGASSFPQPLPREEAMATGTTQAALPCADGSHILNVNVQM